MGVFRFTEAEWAFIEPLLPKQHMGRPQKRQRECLEAIVYKLKTGCQWELLPGEYPPKSTVHDRLCWLEKQGFLEQLFQMTRSPQGELYSLDATIKVAKRGLPRQSGGKIQKQQNNRSDRRERPSATVRCGGRRTA